jgi:Ca-activated chloride channel family protein
MTPHELDRRDGIEVPAVECTLPVRVRQIRRIIPFVFTCTVCPCASIRFLLVLVHFVPLTFGQRSPVFTATSSIVMVPSSVADEAGNPVTDLAPADFELYVDGVRHRIANVWTDVNRPLLLGVVNDVSASQGSRTTERERDVERLMEQLLHGTDRAFVVGADDKVMLRSEVRRGAVGLLHVFLPPRGEPLGVQCGEAVGIDGRLHPACGGSALWNAIYACARLKLTSPSANKVLLVLSDGNDTGSTHSFSEALEEIKKSGTIVYAVVYPDKSGAASSGELQRLARETGGQSFALQDRDVASVLSKIATTIRSRYILGFVPDLTTIDGRVHTLKVVVRRRGVVVRARSEYASAY